MPTEENLKKAIEEILNGLLTDGAHHKQYCLEEALKHLFDAGTETVGKKNYLGKTYKYEKYVRPDALLEYLNKDGVFFDDQEIPDEVEESGEYYSIEPGIPG